LRRLARSGAATTRISSAPTSTRLVQAFQAWGTSSTTQGTLARKASNNRLEGVSREIIDAVERGGRREQAQMVGAARQQAIDEGGIDPVRGEDRVSHALRRILVVIQSGRAEGEIEIRNHRIERKVARDRPRDIVGDRGGADAALGADDRDDAPDGFGVRRREQAADRADHVDRQNR